MLAPKKAEAFLLLGCLLRDSDEGWGDLADLNEPRLFCKHNLDVFFKSWICRVGTSLTTSQVSRSKSAAPFAAERKDPNSFYVVRWGVPARGVGSSQRLRLLGLQLQLRRLTSRGPSMQRLRCTSRRGHSEYGACFGCIRGTPLAIACMPWLFAKGFALLPDTI